MQLRNLPEEEFQVMVTKMLTGLERRVDELSKNFNKEIENNKKNQSELKNTINEMKKTY